ncbi:MAG TPA: hypothetical protein VGM49_08925 [Candidatus Limnocylindrales bacterium]
MRPRLRWQDLPPIGFAAVFGAYGLYLLLIGPFQTIVTPDDGSVTFRDPNVAGLLPLAAGVLVVYGMWAGRERVSWGGAALAMLFSVAFLFSLGGVFIPVAALLLMSLALRRLLKSRRTSTEA